MRRQHRRWEVIWLVVGLAGAVAAWPTPGVAQVGGEGQAPVGDEGQAPVVSGDTVVSDGALTLIYQPPQGTSADPADPDSFDSAVTPGSYTVSLNGTGTSANAPGALGSCTPSSDESSATLDLPSMRIATSPAAPVDGALGGVVGTPTSAWIVGYRGGTVSGPVARIQYTTCSVDSGAVPPTIRSKMLSHTAQLSIRVARRPGPGTGRATGARVIQAAPPRAGVM